MEKDGRFCLDNEKIGIEDDNGRDMMDMEGHECSIPSSSNSNWNPCPICLDRVNEVSYLDKCFHKFCYICIKRWITTVASKESSTLSCVKCPMCRTDNFSVIYGYDGTDFLRDYVDKNVRSSTDFFSDAHRYRLKCYYLKQDNHLADRMGVSRYWKSGKYLHQNVSLDHWLRREIQAILQDGDVIVHHLLGVIGFLQRGWLKNAGVSTESVRKEFKMLVSEAAKPFMSGRTEIFVKELELFMASGFNIEAFDEVYMKHLGWKLDDRRAQY